MKKIGGRIPCDDLAKLRALAETRKKSMSCLVREALLDFGREGTQKIPTRKVTSFMVTEQQADTLKALASASGLPADEGLRVVIRSIVTKADQTLYFKTHH